MRTLDINFIRYLNLFERVTRVRTKNCFIYNNNLIFAVPASQVSRAIGENGGNIRRINEILGRRVKVIAFPTRSIIEFIARIVEPIKFRSIDVLESEVIINAGRQSKAALIGRDRIRLQELNEIIKNYFNKEVKII